MLEGKHILVGISGGIAAYKIPELIRQLKKAGAEVRVTTTKHALEFVTELTLQTVSGAKVYHDVFAAINEHSTEHISLPDWADMLLVAPATANVLGKMASGIADDALTTTYAATIARKPVVIAPAMNDKMYESAATEEAIHALREHGAIVLEAAEGELACGTSGKGRMQEIDILQEAIEDALSPKSLKGRKILLTVGPTQEKIDPVRYISNHSTGKMGFAIARECLRRGAEVTVVAGPCSQPRDLGLYEEYHCVAVRSAAEMAQATIEAWSSHDTAVLCAAVADFSPIEVAEQKIKKEKGQTEMSLRLGLTTDIAAALGKSKQAGQQLVGFALETHDEEGNAEKKLAQKNLDMIVLNSLQDAGAGFGYDTNKVTLIQRQGTKTYLPLLSKQEVAQQIVDRL